MSVEETENNQRTEKTTGLDVFIGKCNSTKISEGKKSVATVHKLIGNKRKCPNSFYKASIIQYLKLIEYKIERYGLVSLMNTNQKVLIKILAKRIQYHIENAP